MYVGVTYKTARVLHAQYEIVVTICESQLCFEQALRISFNHLVVNLDRIGQVSLADETIVIRGVMHRLARVPTPRIISLECSIFNFVQCEQIDARHRNCCVDTAACFIKDLHPDGRRVVGLEYCRELTLGIERHLDTIHLCAQVVDACFIHASALDFGQVAEDFHTPIELTTGGCVITCDRPVFSESFNLESFRCEAVLVHKILVGRSCAIFRQTLVAYTAADGVRMSINSNDLVGMLVHDSGSIGQQFSGTA